MTKLRDALMIIRAWVERGSSAPLRVSIRRTSDASKGIEHSATVTTSEAGAAAVKEWLDEVVELDHLGEAAEEAEKR